MSKIFTLCFSIFAILRYVSGSCCGEKADVESSGPLNDYTLTLQKRASMANKEQIKTAIMYTRTYVSDRFEQSLTTLSLGGVHKVNKTEKALSKNFKECAKLGIATFCRDFARFILLEMSRTPDDVIREITAEVTGENSRASIIELQIPESEVKERKHSSAIDSPDSPSSSSSSSSPTSGLSGRESTEKVLKSPSKVSQKSDGSPRSAVSPSRVGSSSKSTESSKSSDKTSKSSVKTRKSLSSSSEHSAPRSSDRAAKSSEKKIKSSMRSGGGSESVSGVSVRSPEHSATKPMSSSRLQSRHEKTMSLEAVTEIEHLTPDGRLVKEGKFVSGDLVKREELNEETILLVARSVMLLIEDELNNRGLTIDTATRDILSVVKETVFSKFEHSLAKRIKEDPYISASPGVERFLWSYLFYAEADISNSGNNTES
ncbi:hypothetical protein FG386_001661 [Cryptosporidium ryanae]|uniref:uncharacterized protein n=1 Tax=Cryptosporidium ryanae TaxID=515981 RepID=UPI00351AA542|nr:hypothetical protein FG386_001661 [Cryptosporidium ryanae]